MTTMTSNAVTTAETASMRMGGNEREATGVRLHRTG